MAKTKFGYGWTIKWGLAAVLIAAGVLMLLNDETVVYATTGIAVVIFSVLRVVPLMKTLTKEVLRTINLIEIIFDLIIGGLMIYVAFSGNSGDAFWQGMYGYILAFFLLTRGIIYFVSLYYFGEKTEPAKFWVHLIFVGLGPVVLTLTVVGNDIISILVWVLFIFSIGGAGYLGYDGYGGYKKYRENSKALNTKKEVKKEVVKDPKIEKEIPQPIQEEVKEEETYVN
ncbi:MAG: hypothetical protein KAH13_03210 [Tenericutes bacterium]|nr:hypothetical protein [Mycoplasmatota bacterium]